MEQARALVSGCGVTVAIFLGAAVLGTVCAFLGGLGRLSRDPILRGVARAYVEVFRGSSVLVLLFWFAYAFPALGVKLPLPLVGVLVPGLSIGAYGAEVVRGALLAVPKGQHEAALALNLTSRQRMRHVVLPQAVRAMLPPFGNLLIELLKTTALVSLVLLTDLTKAAKQLADHTGLAVPTFALVLALYFVLATGLAFGVRRLERRFSRGVAR